MKQPVEALFCVIPRVYSMFFLRKFKNSFCGAEGPGFNHILASLGTCGKTRLKRGRLPERSEGRGRTTHHRARRCRASAPAPAAPAGSAGKRRGSLLPFPQLDIIQVVSAVFVFYLENSTETRLKRFISCDSMPRPRVFFRYFNAG